MPVKYINHPVITDLKMVFGIDSNAQLAKILGVTAQHLSRINCEKLPVPKYFKVILEAYNIGVAR